MSSFLLLFIFQFRRRVVTPCKCRRRRTSIVSKCRLSNPASSAPRPLLTFPQGIVNTASPPSTGSLELESSGLFGGGVIVFSRLDGNVKACKQAKGEVRASVREKTFFSLSPPPRKNKSRGSFFFCRLKACHFTEVERTIRPRGDSGETSAPSPRRCLFFFPFLFLVKEEVDFFSTLIFFEVEEKRDSSFPEREREKGEKKMHLVRVDLEKQSSLPNIPSFLFFFPSRFLRELLLVTFFFFSLDFSPRALGISIVQLTTTTIQVSDTLWSSLPSSCRKKTTSKVRANARRAKCANHRTS